MPHAVMEAKKSPDMLFASRLKKIGDVVQLKFKGLN
jgi:hypothetical protein